MCIWDTKLFIYQQLQASTVASLLSLVMSVLNICGDDDDREENHQVCTLLQGRNQLSKLARFCKNVPQFCKKFPQVPSCVGGAPTQTPPGYATALLFGA